MLIFIAIALGSFILLTGSFFFGHDHDADHTDAGHAGEGHDLTHDTEPTINIFSIKVLATFTMGFGAAGAIARSYGADYVVSSLIGLGSGMVLSLVMYLVLNLIYRQQASSLIPTTSAVGLMGTVDTSIDPPRQGEVSLSMAGQHMLYLAKSASGKAIPKGRTVRVVATVGSQLVVEEIS